ncbi:hypothetical protein EJ05DRAFT_477023 [Pseudovirgaria hyperparasitica]|uniref:DM2 domain-containing protein n=1 Tax=Pseudovirgaria hyperparasitica TaxID=470096 RepID=A0A6A6W8A0_9PEZI|nr:uncharacterized protein EJ05DRAFT_477023 [Pseudovirgaria hyperparasitica]KAF2757807.1 hypothetical protein EJ05DRAFT_477023 [Pseudovirgaria hyperparasitica]
MALLIGEGLVRIPFLTYSLITRHILPSTEAATYTVNSSMITKADLMRTFRNAGPLTGVPPPHTVNAAAQQQLQMQQAADAHRRELGKRIARKPTDKNLPDGVEDIMIGDSVQEYRKLRDVEKRLDSVMMRKRLDITDSMNRSMTRYRTMRIWISNTAENQPWQQGSMETDVFDFTSENNATYKVRIEGRLLDDDDDGLPGKEWDKGTNGEADEDQDAVDQDGDNTTKRTATKPASTSQRTKLSHFFKSIIIDFDRSKHLQPDGFTQIEWKRPTDPASQEANFDSLEFERKSDENINVTVNLVRDDQPERFRLSKPLAELLDTEEDERANVMMGIWNYIKAQNLQEDEDTRRVQCDARLKAVC